MGTPMLYTKMTKTMGGWTNTQWNGCADFQMDYYKCASRVGKDRADIECYKLLKDFQECWTRNKQIERAKRMKAERKRQGKPFLPAPGMDSWNDGNYN